ncbi:aldo/keto reductase [Myroides injenensis]|uniref:aldo/keto reductase n=1 Tax=Myroides injenensis TaxID=1183151 RepID=UPI000474CF66|nr:aldo/keto reductase [Myroides injenensis]
MMNYKLSNGVLVPKIGFGTWKLAEGDETVKTVLTALEVGYRHIDTAYFYKNEVSIGKALSETDIDRKDIFLTTKLWNADRGYDQTLKAFEISLNNLEVDYIDLYLIHWPAAAHQFEDWQQINSETWKAFEYLYNKGLVRAIGISNFQKHHLEPLIATADIKPMVNQLEFHPGFLQEDIINYCEKEDILVEAWSPLGRGNVLDNMELQRIAAKYNVSVAQLCLRWIIQKGHLPIPKSSSIERMKNNLNIFNFNIEDSDVVAIDNLPYIGGSGQNPDSIDF